MPYPTKKLWEISDFQWGSQPPKKEFIFEYKEWYVRFLQIRDFSNDKNITYIPKWNKNKLCVEDDILIWRYWASVWKILIWIAGAYNVALMKTFPDLSLIEKRFFYYYLKSDIFQIPLLKVSARAAQAWFSKKDIEDLPIPLPPLPTQKLIVQKLDSAFKNIDESIKITKKNIENIEELNKSVLESVFQDWKYNSYKLSEICTIERWWSPRPIKDFITNDENWVNWIKIWDTKNITKYIEKTNQKIKPEWVKRSRMVYPWDFILSNSMSFWRPYIMKTTWCIHDWWLVLRTDKKIINDNFLYHLIGSPYIYEKFVHTSSWTTVKNLNISKVKEIVIDIPPLEKQKEIVAYLDEVFEKNKVIKEWYEKKLKDLEEMKQSILKEAFENEEFVK